MRARGFVTSVDGKRRKKGTPKAARRRGATGPPPGSLRDLNALRNSIIQDQPCERGTEGGGLSSHASRVDQI